MFLLHKLLETFADNLKAFVDNLKTFFIIISLPYFFVVIICGEIKFAITSVLTIRYGNKKWNYENLTKKEKKLVRRMFSANTKLDPRLLHHITLEEIKKYHTAWSYVYKYGGDKNKEINLLYLEE